MDRSFSILQALVNIQAHLHNRVNIFPTDYRPVSNFDHGPNYFLFNQTQSEWCDAYWIADVNYEKLWRDKSINISQLMPALPTIRKHRTKLFQSPFRDRLIDTLLNLNASWKAMTKARRATFIWMALEGLYSDKGTPSDQATIIRRATHSLEPDVRDLAADRLRFIAEMRNGEVHNFGGLADTDPAHIILQAVNLYAVSCYLELLNLDTKQIRNDNDFITLTELPASAKELMRRNRIYNFAIKNS